MDTRYVQNWSKTRRTDRVAVASARAGGEVSATPCYRLMAPHRPEEYRQETWGVLHAEQVRSLQRGSLVLRADHDFRQMCERIPSKVPIYFMTGLYGWACTPEKTQSTAGRRKNSECIIHGRER